MQGARYFNLSPAKERRVGVNLICVFIALDILLGDLHNNHFTFKKSKNKNL